MQTVTDSEVRSAVPMRDAVAAVRRGFLALAAGEFDLPPRVVLGDGQFLVMSATHRPTRSAVVKILSVNLARDPSLAGTVVWTQLDRAQSLIADARVITSLRTGAAVGVATDLLASPDARTLVLFGSGEQSCDQVRAVHAVRPLERVTVFDRHPGRVPTIFADLGAELPDTDLRVGSSVASALADADLICCATPATEPLFSADMLPERVHVNAIGAFRAGMRELPDELLAAGTVVVDQRAAALAEAGDIMHAIAAGALTADDLIELGPALAAPPPPRHARTVFKSVGIAMQDWVIADLLAAAFLP